MSYIAVGAEAVTKIVERATPLVALGRKNALFVGSAVGGGHWGERHWGERHWAIIATLIQTAKLNGVDRLAWLTDVLERIVSGRTKRNELATLLPWHWKEDSATQAGGTE